MPDYQTGFGNHFATEAIPGALPVGRNSPQKPAFGLYTEQLSGTAFTAPRHENRRTWLYRLRPSAAHPAFMRYEGAERFAPGLSKSPLAPNRLRWRPLEEATDADWLDSLTTMVVAGDGPRTQAGVAMHLYHATRDMTDRAFASADGELLILPEQGALLLLTEMGRIDLAPGQVAVIPRGVRFRVELPDGPARGYVAENHGQPFRLPDLGPIGSNGLANPRDFETPVAWFEDREGDFALIQKFEGALWQTQLGRSPLDVVAWHGNYAPYRYDLKHFNAIGTVSFDHPDPSIFTVLTSPSNVPGRANADFVIFPPRWMVGEHTFRPPYFHRNIMNEYMGLIFGVYDAKAEGFLPGGASLHNCMSGHGPDAATFEQASGAELQPRYLADTLAFMFETRSVLRPTKFAMDAPQRQRDYQTCWQGLRKNFSPA